MSNRPAPRRFEGRVEPTTVPREADLDHVRAVIEGIRYGEVRVVIQDGVIVLIERLEKHRLR